MLFIYFFQRLTKAEVFSLKTTKFSLYWRSLNQIPVTLASVSTQHTRDFKQTQKTIFFGLETKKNSFYWEIPPSQIQIKISKILLSVWSIVDVESGFTDESSTGKKANVSSKTDSSQEKQSSTSESNQNKIQDYYRILEGLWYSHEL